MAIDESVLRAGNENWYRNETWGSEIEAAFFAKLGRARSQRDQYLAIQIGYLARPCPEDCLRLTETYFETRMDHYHDGQVWASKVQAIGELGGQDAVVEGYRDAIAWQDANPNFDTRVRYEFPYFVARNKMTSEYDAVADVLARALDPVFPDDRYKFHAAWAIISNWRGDAESAHVHAEQALQALEATDSGFAFHPALGLVKKRDNDMVRRLKEIAKRGGSKTPFAVLRKFAP